MIYYYKYLTRGQNVKKVTSVLCIRLFCLICCYADGESTINVGEPSNDTVFMERHVVKLSIDNYENILL